MSSRAAALLILLLIGNLFVSMVAATNVACPPPPKTPSPPKTPKPPSPHKTPSPPKAPSKCPIDTLKLGVCANLLPGVISIVIGKPANTPCCAIINGLADLEAAVCLCTAIKANILGINLNVAVDLSLILNYCGKKIPYGYICA